MRRTLRLTTTVLVAATLLLAGCGDDTEQVDADKGDDRSDQVDKDQVTPPGEEPTTAGPIASVQAFTPVTEDCTPAEDLDPDGSVSSDDPPICTPADADVLGTFLIAPETGAGEVDAASVTVDKDTLLLVGDDSRGWQPGSFEALMPGTEVKVWAGGAAMADSYPVQFTAQAVTYPPPAPGHDIFDSTTAPAPTTSTGSQPLPTGEPTSTGVVLSAEPCPEFNPSTPGTCADGLIGTVVVDAIGDKGSDLSARVTDRTVVLVYDGNAWVSGSLNDIQPNDPVRVWVDADKLTKSLPAQGEAATIAVEPIDR